MRVGWLLTAPLPHWVEAGVTGFDEEGDIEKGWRKVRVKEQAVMLLMRKNPFMCQLHT